MMTKEEFWDWFILNNDRFLMIDELDEVEQDKWYQAFEENLEAYAEGLDYEIGDLTNSGRELVISAQGDLTLFESVTDLIDAAPELDWWEFIPFRQAQGSDLIVHFERKKYDLSKMYFLPLENEEEPELLGLQIAMPNYNVEDEESDIAAFLCVESVIGEYDAATLVAYVEAVAVPQDINESDFIPFKEFPNFIEWVKDRQSTTD